MRKRINVFSSVNESLLSNQLYKIKYLLGLILCIAGISSTINAEPWHLDPTFGNGGIANPSNFPVSYAPGVGMALQADGKIVMVGGFSGAGPGFVVARFNSNGSIDSNFGFGGTVVMSFGDGTTDIGSSVAVQSDGKIVVAGQTTQPSTTYVSAAVARLNSDGTLDTTFDGDGMVTVAFTFNQISYSTYPQVVKVANDGKIVFAGGSANGSAIGYLTTVGRLNPNGSLDTTFDQDGKVIDGDGLWTDLIVQPDGTMVAVGNYSLQTRAAMKAAKYNNDGNRAWSYSRGLDFQFMSLSSVAAQADGKFVAVGNLNSSKIIAIRLNADGTLDNTFTEADVSPNGFARSVAIQSDGKIIAGIYFTPTSTDGFSLIRYNPNGTLDTNFGDGGIIRTSLSNGTQSHGRKLLIQPDGKYLIGGYRSSYPGATFVMVRYMGEAAPVPPPRNAFDYDGDGRSDISVFRPSENRWYILKSSDSSVIQPFFGLEGDIPVPADYDGDRKTDIAVFRPAGGMWVYISSNSNAQFAIQWGQSGDIPRPSDFNGDGIADFVFYRPSNGSWYRLNGAGQSSQIAFGLSDDKPLIGDFDGDGKADPAIYRPSTGAWWYASSGSAGAHRAVQFGISTDIPVPADFDGDGKTDFAVYRPSDGGWHILQSSNGNYVAFPFGASEDKPVVGDYDGDSKADVGVFRPSNGNWYILRSTSGYSGVQWGTSTDIPTENSFIQ